MHTASIQESQQLSADNQRYRKSAVDDLGDVVVSSELIYACRNNITHRARPYRNACSRVCPAALLSGFVVGSGASPAAFDASSARKYRMAYFTRCLG